MNERAEKTTACLLVVIGFVQMVLHPRKTYNLLVHKVGWYDVR